MVSSEAYPSAIAGLTNTVGGTAVFRNVYKTTATTSATTEFNLANWTSFTLDGFYIPAVTSNNTLLKVGTGYTVNTLTVNNVIANLTTATGIQVSGTVDTMFVNNYKINATDTSNTYGLYFSGTTGRVLLNNTEMINTAGLARWHTGSTTGPVIATNTYITGANRIGVVLANADITLNGLSATTLAANTGFYVSGSGIKATVRGSGINRMTAWSGFALASSGTARCLNIDYPADLATLDTNAGDKTFATAGAVAGPSYYTGSAWKSVYSLP